MRMLHVPSAVGRSQINIPCCPLCERAASRSCAERAATIPFVLDLVVNKIELYQGIWVQLIVELDQQIAAARAKWQVLYDGAPGVITLDDR